MPSHRVRSLWGRFRISKRKRPRFAALTGVCIRLRDRKIAHVERQSAHFPPSLHSRIFHIHFFSGDLVFASAETGSTFLLFGTKRTIALNSITSLFGPIADMTLSNAWIPGRRGGSCPRRRCAALKTSVSSPIERPKLATESAARRASST